MQSTGHIQLGKFSAHASQLEHLSIDVSFGDEIYFLLSGVSFPRLKSLEVDMSFEFLSLVAAVVGGGDSQLESFSLTELKYDQCYYHPNQMRTVIQGLRAAMACMSQLRELTLRTDYLSDHVLK